MDPVSHALLGAAVASVPAQLPLRRAALLGAVAALMPDLDVLISSEADPLLQVEMHRHFTHALVTAPLLGALVAGAAWRFWRGQYWRLWLCATLAVLSAGLLDACTSYGTHLLWPFSDERIAWSIIAVVDPMVWLLLVVPLGFAIATRNAGLSAVAVVCCVGYLVAGAMQQERAADAVRILAAERGHEVERIVVKPTLGNLLLWRGLYQSSETGQPPRAYVSAVRVGLFSRAVLYPGGDAKLLPADAIAPAGSVHARDAARFDRLSAGFVVRHPSKPDVYGDIRFALRADGLAPMFGIHLDPQTPDRPAAFLELRDWDDAAWIRFKAMLGGRSLPPLQSIPDSTNVREDES